LPDREELCGFGYDMLRPVEAPWAGNADALPWVVDSAASLKAPPRDRWITIRGRFDHPSATRCGDGDPAGRLICRLDFVVSAISLG
jgi:hypothetical protein